MACLLNVEISAGARSMATCAGGMPVGRCSKAFCSSETWFSGDDVVLMVAARLDFERERLMGLPSPRFLGRPRSMIEEAPSESPRR